MSAEISEEMLDAQSIFIYKAIQKCSDKVKIFAEMSYASNIEFLKQRETSKAIEH